MTPLMHKPGVEWKPVPDYEDYLCSNLGVIYSKKTDKFLKGKISRRGYCHVYLYNTQGRRLIYLHRITAVLYVYNPHPLTSVEVNHDDGNKLNNAASNLKWTTPLENKIHAIQTGLREIKLTVSDVQAIRNEPTHIRPRFLAKKYGVSPEHISDIRNYKRWAHV